MRDTDPAAQKAQLTALRDLGLEGRARLTFELNEDLRSVIRAGIRWRHPDYDAEQVHRAFLRIVLGDALYRQIFPGSEIQG